MGETRTSTLVDQSIAAAGSVVVEAPAREREVMCVFWVMDNATNKNDIGSAEVRAVDPDGNVLPDVLTPEVISAKSLNGAVATLAHRYNVQGLNVVQIKITNTAAAARNAKVFVNHYWS